MSFATVAVMLPVVIQAIDMLDDVVINIMNMAERDELDPTDAADLALMVSEFERSQMKRRTALENLRLKIEAAAENE